MLLVADIHQSWKKNKPSKAKKGRKRQNKRKTRGKQEAEKTFCCGVRSRSEILRGGKRGNGGNFCYPGNAKRFIWSVTRMWCGDGGGGGVFIIKRRGGTQCDRSAHLVLAGWIPFGYMTSEGKYCYRWVHFCVDYSYVKECVLTD